MTLRFGQPCKYGHPWNRNDDWRACITCFPLTQKQTPMKREDALARIASRQRMAEDARKRAVDRTAATLLSRAAGGRRRDSDWARSRANYLRRFGMEVTAAGLRAMLVRQGNRCALTRLPIGGAVNPSVDHIIPLGRGGGHALSNIQLVHPKANMAKHEGTVQEFEDWVLAAARSITLMKQAKGLM